jgi:hypothetical protein
MNMLGKMGPMGMVAKQGQKMLTNPVGKAVAKGIASKTVPGGGVLTDIAAKGARQAQASQKRVAAAESIRDRMDDLLEAPWRAKKETKELSPSKYRLHPWERSSLQKAATQAKKGIRKARGAAKSKDPEHLEKHLRTAHDSWRKYKKIRRKGRTVAKAAATRARKAQAKKDADIERGHEIVRRSMGEHIEALHALIEGMPFLKQDRPAKTKEIYRALKRDHPEMSPEMKARIAIRRSRKTAHARKPLKSGGPAYKAPITPE